MWRWNEIETRTRTSWPSISLVWCSLWWHPCQGQGFRQTNRSSTWKSGGRWDVPETEQFWLRCFGGKRYFSPNIYFASNFTYFQVNSQLLLSEANLISLLRVAPRLSMKVPRAKSSTDYNKSAKRSGNYGRSVKCCQDDNNSIKSSIQWEEWGKVDLKLYQLYLSNSS